MTLVNNSSRNKFKIYRDILSDKTKKPPRLSTKWHVIIWQLVNNPNLFSKKDWPREIKLAKSVWEFYPNLDFWSQINLEWYPDSLNYFLSGKGKKTLFKKLKDFKLHSKINLKLPPEIKYDQAAKFQKRLNKKPDIDPKTFFLNGKKTK